MLYEQVVEVDERMGAHGEVVRPLNLSSAEAGLRQAYDRGIRAARSCFMHGYRYPAHEIEVAALARRIGFTQISVSHQVSPLMKLVSRGDTTVVDAYLSPVLRRYVDQVAAQLGGVRLQFMQSSGGLADARSFSAARTRFCPGPRAASSARCERRRMRDSIASSASTWVGRRRTWRITPESSSARSTPKSPAFACARRSCRSTQSPPAAARSATSTACACASARIRQAPIPDRQRIAAADPLTVTDCNVVLGRIQPDFFPAVFGRDGDQPLDGQAAAAQFASLAQRIGAATGTSKSAEEIAAGCIRIAVDNMANAIKKISVQRGHDVTGYALACFGGAGGQHACQVADALGMRRVFLHPLAGVLSAYGIGLADVIAMKQRAVEGELDDELLPELDAAFVVLETQARESVLRARHCGRPDSHRAPAGRQVSGDRQHVGGAQRTAMPRRCKPLSAICIRNASAFSCPIVRSSSNPSPSKRSGRRRATGVRPVTEAARGRTVAPVAVRRVYFEDRWQRTSFFDRATLRAGDVIDGPAVVLERNTTTVIEPGWRATVTLLDHLMLTREQAMRRDHAIGTRADPVLLEVFNNLFMSIAEQMGVTLANTATSVNIKERLDFSCALFDSQGQLIANAPHMPVHLGSMGESVQEIIRRRAGAPVRPGDMFVLNAPYAGGTHLPDVTVVMPVQLRGVNAQEDPARRTFYVAARGHHADIGGITPGSMPADSTHIEQEGVLIDNKQLVGAGRFLDDKMRALLASGRYPARNIEQNLADLRAQVAACQRGATELHKMVEQFGLPVVQAYMQHVQRNAEEAVRRVIDKLHHGTFDYEMDGGAHVRVSIRIDSAAREATIDFTGTSPQQPNNFNAPVSVTRAAALYVFRTLVDDEIPMNAGCMKPLRLIVPAGCMLNPSYPAAVVAGNVETSQVVTDSLYGALGVLAASQGTMNNFTFGDGEHQYYETIAGGAGAGPEFDGASAVQTHMTNSRLTDPEVLEWRFPVRLEEFRIRRGSGGAGRRRGGDGVERRIRFLKPMQAVLLANHRRIAPFGVAGGSDGATGENWIERTDGSIERFGATHAAQMNVDDVFVIRTPGGGGFG